MKNCFYPADILLPDFSKVDGKRWAVIACDQFTSEPEYWEEASKLTKDHPSALKLILPEAHLSLASELTPGINKTMDEYLENLFVTHKSAMIYVEREQPSGGIRRGIVGAVDLECYDYSVGSTSMIRATEGTVLDRIPPRVAIRRGASVELPHIMLLIDDSKKTVIEPLIDAKLETAYDFDLMQGGGHIKGAFLTKAEQERVAAALDALISAGNEKDPLLFAVGDGNHSLASAKAHYEEIKAKIGEDAAKDHPARYALVEVVNLHDSALNFEPIYRVMFGVDPQDVIAELEKYVASLDGSADPQTITYVGKKVNGKITVKSPTQQLAVGTLQCFIDGYIKAHSGASVDYIHGEDSTEKLASKDDTVGFLFDGMEKSQLFPTVILDGALPRKTFSMGHARDKRYYIEARNIK